MSTRLISRCNCLGYVAIVENSTPMLRAKTAGIAAVLQSLSGVVFVSEMIRVADFTRTPELRTPGYRLIRQNYTVPIMLSAQKANWGAKTGKWRARRCGDKCFADPRRLRFRLFLWQVDMGCLSCLEANQIWSFTQAVWRVCSLSWSGLLFPRRVGRRKNRDADRNANTFFMCSQTQGRTYEELDELYERRLPAWRFKAARTTKDEQALARSREQ